jgi:hypothetical protein
LNITKKKTAILALALIALVATVSAVTFYKMWEHGWTISIIKPKGLEAIRYEIVADFPTEVLYEQAYTANITYANMDPNYAYSVRCNFTITFTDELPDDWGDGLDVDDISIHWVTWNGTAIEHDFWIPDNATWTLSGETLIWQGTEVIYEVGESGWHEITLIIHSGAPFGTYTAEVYVEGYPLKP